MINNLFSVRRISFAVIGLILSYLCVSPALAQPTRPRPRPIPYQERMEMANRSIKELDQISSQIENDKPDVSLYKKRLEIYAKLRGLYFDDNDKWKIYDERYEADLSRVIELEQTAQNYLNRGQWFISRFAYSGSHYPLPNKISDLYPHNNYFDKSIADILKAAQLTSASDTLEMIYNELSFRYRLRPLMLLSVPDFPKWKDEIPLELVRQDLNLSIKYSELALKDGAKLPHSQVSKTNLLWTYEASAEIATKLGDSATALKFTQTAQKYRE